MVNEISSQHIRTEALHYQFGFKGLLEFNGREWTKFTPAHSLKNEQQKPRAWNERRQSFAAFCREELIDCEDYWLLAEIINEFDMEFILGEEQSIKSLLKNSIFLRTK